MCERAGTYKIAPQVAGTGNLLSEWAGDPLAKSAAAMMAGGASLRNA